MNPLDVLEVISFHCSDWYCLVFSISFLKELRNDTEIELKYKVRYRQTNSEFAWVESLKTFYDNQFMLKITYDIDIDLFY